MRKETKYIRTQRPQVAMALQQFVLEISEAVKEGYFPDNTIENHARQFSPADFSVALVRWVDAKGEVITFAKGVKGVKAEKKEEVIQPTTGGSEELLDRLTEVAQEIEAATKIPPEGEEEEEEGDDSSDVDLDTLTTKAALLDYAKEVGVEVPSDKRNVPAIRKWLKEAV